jgi:hypothetical protein
MRNSRNRTKMAKPRRPMDRLTVGLLIAFGALAIATAVVAFFVARNLFSSWTMTDLPGVPEVSNQSSEMPETLPGGTPASAPLQSASGPTPVPWDGASRITMLVMGLDYRDWEAGDGPPRTDTMILLTADPTGPGTYRLYREPIPFRDTADYNYPSAYLRERAFAWDTMLGNLSALHGFEQLAGYTAAVPALGHDMLETRLDLALLELYNVRFIISAFSPSPPAEPGVEVIHNDPRTGFRILALPRALPRAYWVPRAQGADDEREAEALLRKVDWRTTVVLTTADEVEASDGGDFPLVAATIKEYSPDMVRVSVKAPERGWLVLSDRYYPGWSATVDGRPVKIYCANVMVRGVEVGPGEHTVVFRFQARGFIPAAGLTLLAWLATIVWWLRLAAGGPAAK